MTAASSHVNLRRPEAGRRHRPFRAVALVALAGALAFAAQAALAQAATRLTNVELQPQPGNQLEVKLVLDGPAPQPVAFTIDNPARLAIDLPGTSVALESRRIDVNSSGVDSIVAAEASGRTRVVFNLDSLQPYSTRTDGNNVYVSIGGASGNAASGTAVSTAGAVAAAPGAFTIDKVDFRRGTDGAGRIMIRTNDPRVQASLKQEGGRLVVDFPRTKVAPDAARRYDVVDFATPVSSFDVTSTPTGARIVVAATGDYEQLGYQSDRDYVLELRPRVKSAVAADPGKREYKGERLTLNFQDIETRAVLQLLAETQRPEHRRQRHGAGQRHAAPAERAVGPGARHRHAHEGPRQAPGRQRHLRRAGRGTGGAREAAARVAEVDDRTRAGPHRVPAGQLRQGV